MTLVSENSSIVIQHSWGTAQLWNNSGEAAQVRRPKCSCASVNSSSWGNTLRWKFNVSYTETEVKLAYIEKNAYLQSLIGRSVGPLLYKWGLRTIRVGLVQIAPRWLVRMEQLWLVSKDTNEDVSAQLGLDRESLRSTGWISILGTLLYKGWLIMQKQCTGCELTLWLFSDMQFARQASAIMAARLQFWIGSN